jgi:hypothetical protein
MVSFNFSYDPGTTIQQMVGMELAGRIWSSYLRDPITLNIHVGVASSSSLPSRVIGGALPGFLAKTKFEDVAQQLQLEAGNLNYASALNPSTYDGRSFDDKVAANNLGTRKENEAWFDAFVKKNGTLRNNGFLDKTNQLNVTRANAKALGLTLKDPSILDGYVLFSDLANVTTSSGQSISWNYNFTGATAPGRLDFLSTAVHEIGHILGFVSALDRPGWLNNTFDDDKVSVDFKKSVGERVKETTPLDLFRFSDKSRTMFDKDGFNYRDMSYGEKGGAKFFSIDGSFTRLGTFSTGQEVAFGGDGSQASHWTQGLGIMAPKLATGVRATISAIDLRAMDVIGWDLRTNSAGAFTASTNPLTEQQALTFGAQNSASLVSTAIDLSTLQTQVIQSLATRSGQTTSWIVSNFTTSPTALVRNRDAEVEMMINSSEIYKWGNEDGDGRWQKMLNLFRSESLFSSVDELDLSSLASRSAEAEGTPIATLLGGSFEIAVFSGMHRGAIAVKIKPIVLQEVDKENSISDVVKIDLPIDLKVQSLPTQLSLTASLWNTVPRTWSSAKAKQPTTQSTQKQHAEIWEVFDETTVA